MAQVGQQRNVSIEALWKLLGHVLQVLGLGEGQGYDLFVWCRVIWQNIEPTASGNLVATVLI